MASPFSTPIRRARGTPTFLTSHRPAKRVPLREREDASICRARISISFNKGRGRFPPWSQDEVKSLVEFVLLMSDGNRWPTHQRMHILQCAGEFVQQRTKSWHLRSGKLCCY